MIDPKYIRYIMNKEAPYNRGHGSGESHLGFGMVYYAIAYALKARLCVCLGSGGGFVPRCMRQAQRDMAMKDARTILVDNLSGKWGQSHIGDEESFFRQTFDDVEVWIMDTNDAMGQLDGIDYLHIDADHGPQAIEDFWNYAEVMAPHGVVTLHDTATQCSVPELVRLIRDDMSWELINFPDIGAGMAIARRVQ